MIRNLGLIALAALAVAGCSDNKAGNATGTPVAAVAPPAGKAWSDVVSQTAEGGFRMGNPDAPVKLIEYASYTCPHCKVFAHDGAPKLIDKYVKTGRVSYEYRSLLLHAPDAPLSLLMSCRGPASFFPMVDQVFGAQDDMIAKLTALTPADQQVLQSAQPVTQFRMLADRLGMYGFFGARGLPRAQADSCLGDQKGVDALTANQERATALGVNGTPSFLINGELQSNTASWDQLDPLLQQAVGG